MAETAEVGVYQKLKNNIIILLVRLIQQGEGIIVEVQTLSQVSVKKCSKYRLCRNAGIFLGDYSSRISSSIQNLKFHECLNRHLSGMGTERSNLKLTATFLALHPVREHCKQLVYSLAGDSANPSL